jgi:hypothetical protein
MSANNMEHIVCILETGAELEALIQDPSSHLFFSFLPLLAIFGKIYTERAMSYQGIPIETKQTDNIHCSPPGNRELVYIGSNKIKNGMTEALATEKASAHKYEIESSNHMRFVQKSFISSRQYQEQNVKRGLSISHKSITPSAVL